MPVSPYGGYEETLKLKLESEGVEKVKKDLKGFGKQVGLTTKGLLGVAGALGGAALGMGLLFRSSSVLQAVTGALSDIFSGFIDTILVEGMPVFEDLIDVFQRLLEDALEIIIPIVQDMVAIWESLPEPLQDVILVTGILTPLLAGIIIPILILIPAVAGLTAVSLPLILAILILAAAFAAAWLIIENKEYIFAAVQRAGQLLWDVFVGIGTFIVDFFTPYWDALVVVFDTYLKPAIDAVAGAFDWFWNNVLRPLGTWIANTLQPIWDAFVDAIEIVLGGINQVTGGIGAAGDAVGGFFAWIGEGLGLQHGGIVTRPGRYTIGEAGPEAVIPLDEAGGMGGFGGGGPVTIQLMVDGRLVAETVLENLRRNQQLSLRSVI